MPAVSLILMKYAFFTIYGMTINVNNIVVTDFYAFHMMDTTIMDKFIDMTFPNIVNLTFSLSLVLW